MVQTKISLSEKEQYVCSGLSQVAICLEAFSESKDLVRGFKTFIMLNSAESEIYHAQIIF